MALEIEDQQGSWPGHELPVPLTLTSAEPAPQLITSPPGTPTRHTPLTADLILRPARSLPPSGWRGKLFKLTGGLLRIAPGHAELRVRELRAIVKTPIVGCRRIAFLSRKGGVGKTSTCLLAGHTFALHRGDRIVCLDANPDAGTLGHRLQRETTATVTSMLRDTNRIERYADIRAYTSQAPSRLEVVAADDDPNVTEALQQHDYHDAISLLERHYNLVLLDTGTGVLDSATRGVLDAADQLVIITNPTLDGTRAASLTLDWLDQNGYPQLATEAVSVLNAVRSTRGPVDLDQIEQHFRARSRAVIRIPWDPHLDTGAEVDLTQLTPATTDAYLELAAELASSFTNPPPRRC